MHSSKHFGDLATSFSCPCEQFWVFNKASRDYRNNISEASIYTNIQQRALQVATCGHLWIVNFSRKCRQKQSRTYAALTFLSVSATHLRFRVSCSILNKLRPILGQNYAIEHIYSKVCIALLTSGHFTLGWVYTSNVKKKSLYERVI